MGAVEQNIIKQAIQAGEPIPARIANAPQLREGLTFEFDAFFELDGERSHSFGFTQLPLSVIRSYGERYDLHGEDLEEFTILLHKVDLAHIARLEAKKSKSGTDKSSQSRPTPKP